MNEYIAPPKNNASKIVNKSIDTILALSRVIFQCFIDGKEIISIKDNSFIFQKSILQNLNEDQIDFLTKLTDLQEYKTDKYIISSNFLFPFRSIIYLYKKLIKESTIKYYIKKNIRCYYNLSVSPKIISYFNIISASINRKFKNEIANTIGIRSLYEYCINDIIDSTSVIEDKVICDAIKCYLEISIFSGFLIIKDSTLFFRRSFFDSEYLICDLFGMPTDIPGFDTLFGGGGLVLPEFSKNSDNSVPSRTILVSGESGTGKTTLGLQLASEVAQKGGLAWFMPLEQSIEECMYSLMSYQANEKINYYIGESVSEAKIILDQVNNFMCSYGAIIFLHPSKENLNELFSTMIKNASSFSEEKLNLFIVDPINSIGNKEKDASTQDLRNQTLEFIKQLELSNKNVLIIAENYRNIDGKNSHNLFSFLENISDTHIHLSIKKDYNYGQRYFEIKKSRMQREQRGEHAFSIASGKGIHIYPSSASVSAQIRNNFISKSNTDYNLDESHKTKFGIEGIDNIVKDSLFEKDLIVFEGPSGSFKTTLGVAFLLKQDVKFSGRKIKSLWFDTNHSVKRRKDVIIQEAINIVKNIDSEYLAEDDIKLISLASGYINPGYILQVIEETFKNVSLEGEIVNRVMLNGLSQWILTSPFIRNDNIFAVALVDLLRSYGVTSLFLTDSIIEPNNLLESVIDNSNCIFKFERFELKGIPRVTMRVLRSSGMNHDRSLYEIQKVNDKITIEPSTSLIRFISKEGKIAPIKIKLFFHIDSTIQEEYYKSIERSIQAVLSPTAGIDVQDRLYFNKAFQMSQFSAIDELQILQIDEFQLAMHKDTNDSSSSLNGLYKFSDNFMKDQIGDKAVPFFENISFLVYNKKELGEIKFENWEQIAKIIEEKKMHFDFPKKSSENFNCLYLEILLSLIPKDEMGLKSMLNENNCLLINLIDSPIGLQAASLFRKICKHGYDQSFVSLKDKKENDDKDKIDTPITVDHKAVIWRHWYSTLNQMLHEHRELINEIEVVPLPGDITISGKWYLGIPNYSAARDVGVEIIKQLTSRDSELIRFQKGVGLPTKDLFYSKFKEDSTQSLIFNLPNSKLSKLFETSFRRSYFKCYHNVAFGLSSILKDILTFNYTAEDEIIIEKIIKKFRSESEYILDNTDKQFDKDSKCGSCQNCKNDFEQYIKKINN